MKKSVLIFSAAICLLSHKAFAQPANDNCAGAINLGTLPAPAACSGTAPQLGAPVNIAATNVGATPGSPYIYQPGCTGGAMAVPANDVWYSFTASSYEMVASITGASFSTPMIAMYSGTCGSLGGGVGGCAVGSGGSVTLTVQQMVPGTTYYLQVSGATGQSGTFNLSVRNNKDCADCLNASTLTVTPPPVNGMYNPGQVVNFCYHVGQYTQVNTNWLHGVQVTLGSCWAPGSIVATPPPACQGSGQWIWFPTGIGVVNGVNWGPGFYFDTTDPGTVASNNFGDNCSGVQPAGTWNFCFTATVAAGCNPGCDLSVTINTSGDGESGSWTSLGCVDDPPSVAQAVGACCIPTMSSTAAPCGGTGTATATPVGVSGPYNYTWTNSVGTVVSTTSGVAGANTASGLLPGTYTVTVYNTALSCQVTNTVTVAGGGSIATPTAGSNSPVCVGGTLNLSAAPVTGATYSWTGPNSFTSTLQNPSIGGVTALAAGTYTVVATSGGCTASSTVTVVINPNPVTTVNSPTICAGASATLTAGGATTYLWSTGSTLNPISVTPGTTTSYTVTGTTSGCTSTAVATVTVNPLPVTTVNSATVCAGTAATLTAGGATTYLWSTGSSANPLSVSPGATTSYTVTGTTSGCTSTAVSTVTVNPLPTVTVPANITVCNGGNVAASAYTSTPAGGTFTWTNSNPTIGLAASGSGNTPSFTATNAGTTPVTATITVTPTVAGCTGTPGSYTITVNPTPPAPTALDASICSGLTATLTATAPGGTYEWFDAPGGTLLQTGASYTTPALTSTTTYYVQTTVAGCTGPLEPVTVNIIAGLTPNAGPNDSICFGGSTTISVTPNGAGYTYSWSPATGLSSTTVFNPTAAPASTTTYTVLVTDPTGCTGTSSVTVNVDPQITLSVAGIDVTCNGACNGQTIVIPAGGTSPYNYSWTGGCTGAACTGLCPGSYTVTVTDAWGCTATADTSVTQPPLLTATLTGSTPASCNGVCDGTAAASGAGGTPGTGYSYSWNTVPVQNTAAATSLCAGSYTCTITDANSCTATTTVTITEPTVVTIAPIASVTICSGASTTLTASAAGGNGGPYTYSWSPGTGLSSTTVANPTATPASTTTYTVNATDANGCPAAAVTVTVTVNPNLTVVTAGTASICPGASTVISATAALGNGGPYTYSWTPSTGLSSASVANPTASPAATTTYTVTASDGCSPTATATVTVTVLSNPVVAFTGPASGCAPVCVNFIDMSTVAGSTIATWSWNFGDGSSSNLQNPPTHCYPNAGSYNVTLTVTSAAGGCSSSLTMPGLVNVYPIPTADFSSSTDATILDPEVQFTDLSSSGVSYWNWYFGDGDSLCCSTQNPSHVYPNVEGTYPVILIVMNAQGCVDTVYGDAVVNPEFTFFIPNAFSPNGDGVNDGFNGKGVGIKKYEIMIFDRWGNLIWYTDDINKLWDGKANHGSEMAQQDVYVWKVKLTDIFDKKHSYIGTVTIVK